MSFITAIVEMIGGGQELVLGATLLAAALYVWKGVKIGRIVSGVAASTAGYGMIVLGVLGIGIVLGWIDVSPSTMSSHVTGALDWIWSLIGDWVIKKLSEAV